MLLLHTVFILQEKCNTMSGKNICRALIGGINLYTGIMNQQEIISQHSPVKFNNINLISGILLLLADAIVITRAIMEHLQKEE